MTHYSLLIGSSGGGFAATSFVELTSGSSTFSVPTGYNAIHIQYAVGAGGGAMRGADYDKAGGESAGAGGGSGAFISDKIFSVTAGETITYAVGAGGARGTGVYSGSAGDGTDTTLSGSTTGAIFTLSGGGGSSCANGGVQGPVRDNTAGTAGSATINGTAITSGIFSDSDNSVKNVTSNTSGPTTTFNDSGDGAVGNISGDVGRGPGNCNGDNCRINGNDGADSYDGNILGGAGGSSVGAGTAGTAGTRGSGGGGGAAQVNSGSTQGAAGGDGEIKYRFLQVI